MSVSVSNIAAMQAVQTVFFQASATTVQTVFVETVGDFFRFQRGGTATVVANQVVASLDGQGQWHRMGIPNQMYLAAKFWAISETSGSDESRGWGSTQAEADLVPIKTMAELDCRLSGCLSLPSGWTCHQLSNITVGLPLKNARSSEASLTPQWVGTRTTVFTSAGTTYTAENAAANTGPTLAISTLPVSWTASGYVGKLVVSGDGLRCAWALKDNGSKTARLTAPCNPVAATGSVGTEQAFVNGETVNVVDLSALPCWPFREDMAGAIVSDVAITTASVTRTLVLFGASTSLIRSSLTTFKADARPGVLVAFGSVLFGSGFLFGADYSTAFCGALNASLGVSGRASFSVSHSEFDMQNSNIVISAMAGFTAFGTDSHLAIFDCTATALVVSDEAALGKAVRFNQLATIYGSGNTAAILSIPSGVLASLPPAALCTVTTSFGSTLTVVGVAKNFADMPYVDTTKLSGVVNA